MAKKLHDTYGFSYDNLKVLLGGWNTWKENNSKDAGAYPIEIAAGVTPGNGTGSNAQIQVGNGVVQITPGSKSTVAGTPQPTPKP